MLVQFELGQPSHERHFTSILAELSRRGHTVVKTACVRDCPGLARRDISSGDHRSLAAFEAYIRDDEWGPLAYAIRTARDYIRYLRPEHENSSVIKVRMRNMLELAYVGGNSDAGAAFLDQLEHCSGDIPSLARIDRVLATLEASVPVDQGMVDYLNDIGADVFCVTPMLMTQYGQLDLIKAARSLKIPVVFLVGSWDNLTTKGTTHIVPDYTLVWNEIQKDEAANFHGIPPETVRVVGAARFDEFWARKVEVPREQFCAEFGFDASKPIITYLGSSNLISGDEANFVQHWIDAVRTSSNTRLNPANLLLRPHPKFAAGWTEKFATQDGIGVSVSKSLNNDPTLYHCLAHAKLIVGANTSAELEAAIVGRPIYTLEDPSFSSGQAGTIHYEYLAGRLSTVAHSMSEHLSQLAQELERPGPAQPKTEFLKSFLRPGGLDRAASLVTVDAIEGAVSAFRATLPSDGKVKSLKSAKRKWFSFG